MKTIILGGGVIGVTTAYYLAKLGVEVTVIDRQADVGEETSFANAGQISLAIPPLGQHLAFLPKQPNGYFKSTPLLPSVQMAQLGKESGQAKCLPTAMLTITPSTKNA